MSYYKKVKYIDWNEKKNELLKIERDISFEDILTAIDEGNLLALEKHPDQKKYPNQNILVVKIRDYVYVVPFVEDNEKFFLKTIIPSRKATKKYLIKGGGR